ncbi:acetyl esterase/lipase [Duganella sp. SG902]|uniref:alpha/beta hydrolase n=1 Tax=Duganella sp. SG902 TaxID=2587016 RepID=UPI00159D070D|nr:alpha/beta hydrolase [Duganella sp. SG902]NVM80110.1 acetyl esterase/lipase [Duganella sp. SG902]
MPRPYLLLAAGVPLLLVALTACAPLTALNILSPGGGAERTPDLAYGDGPRRKLDVYRPRDGHGNAPVVVFFYGGNWVAGERADYAFVGRALASRGMVAVIADYRLHPEVSYPDFLRDAAQAVAWAAREAPRYGGDPKRLFVMGHSAGAYNAAMIALDGRWLAEQGLSPAALRGWIGLAGPYDFLPIENPTTKPVFHFPDTPPSSQPVNHVAAGAPPALLIAPREDKLVDPQRNTGHLAGALRARGVPVREQYYDQVRHTTLVATLATPLRWLAPTLDQVAGFVADASVSGTPRAQRLDESEKVSARTW